MASLDNIYGSKRSRKDSIIVINLRSNTSGEEREYKREFNFIEAGFRPGGLLEQVLQSLPSPINASYYTLFTRTLSTLKGYEKASRILTLPASNLESVDIQTLFTIAEEQIQNELVAKGRYKTGARPSMLFRRVMKYLPLSLKDGARIEDVAFTSMFTETAGRRDLISDAPDLGSDTPEIAAPVSMIKARTAEELHEKALTHLKARKNRVKKSAQNALSEFLAVRSHLQALKTKTLASDLVIALDDNSLSTPETLGTLQDLSSEELLHFYSHFFCIHGLDNLESIQKWLNKHGDFPGAEQLIQHPFVEQVGLITREKNFRKNTILILLVLSAYYLPPLVLLCCRHLLQIECKWNVGTCNSVTASSIIETPDGFSIRGIKPKTSQLQATDTSQDLANGEDLCEVIPVLLEHRKWLSSNWESKSDSIFVTINLSSRVAPASHIPYERYNDIFCGRYELPRFTSEQLRDQGLNEFYLESHDIHALKAIAGWDSIDTAQSYLGQRIIRILSEANINNFMQALEGSIVWATKGDDYLDRLGIDPKDVDRRLLFPINSDVGDSRASTIDDWLENQDEKIILSVDRIKHTYRQANWYRANWLTLLATNEKRFYDLHLPRILVCLAVEKMIKGSEYSHLYCGADANDR